MQDTFHHVVTGETEMFPEWTGLVHASGVGDPAVPVEAMRDPHRSSANRSNESGPAFPVLAKP